MNKRTRKPNDKEAPPAAETALDTLTAYYGAGDSSDSANSSPRLSDPPHAEVESPPPKKSCSSPDTHGVELLHSSLALTPEYSQSSTTTLEPTQSPPSQPSPEPHSAPTPRLSANPSASSSSTRANPRASPSPTTVYRCDHCSYSHHLATEYARHLRLKHSSKWKPGPGEPDLEHCACGVLYVKGASIRAHRNNCACLEAGHRRLLPSPGCSCTGCAEPPLQLTSCDNAGCSNSHAVHAAAAAAPTPVPGEPAPPTQGPTAAQPAVPDPFNGPPAGEGMLPLAKLRLIYDFEFTAAELDISVVERLYTNQLRRVTKCYNGVFASLRTAPECWKPTRSC